jgi:hypothetical protein
MIYSFYMGEIEKGKETIGKGELVFLGHPGTNIFSGYGLTLQPDRLDYLAGLLMVDRFTPVDGFANKPVISRWQLIKMPTAPLIRLE